MLKRHSLYFAAFLLLLSFACSDLTSKVPKSTDSSNYPSTNNQLQKERADSFKLLVENLKSIGYYISGKEGHVVSKDPTTFIEMNGILNCFHNPFAKSDSGLVAYKADMLIEKFHVAKDRKQNGPSANIIQLKFTNVFAATNWFDKLKNHPSYLGIKLKPKTEIWQQINKLYFVQSYHDPDGEVLNALLNKLRTP